MIPGLKVGLTDWKEKLEQAKPTFVEVYFRVDKISEYQEMFAHLRAHQIKFGLHFWGVLKSGIEPNLLSRHKWIQNQSYFLMRKAIQIAAQEGAEYVNVHPGAFKERILNINTSSFNTTKLKETEYEEGRENLLKNSKRLDGYSVGVSHGKPLQLLFETLPTNVPIAWLKPRSPQNFLVGKQCPIEFYEDLIKAGCFVANDFGHTAASINMETDRYKNLSLQEKRKLVLKQFN